MGSNKLALVLVALLGALTLALAPACGGGDDGDDTTADANTGGNADANTSQPDAATSSTNAIGQACTPSQTDVQGDCPADHVCLSLGGNGAWCSKTCTSQNDPVCGTDYTGPGLPLCVYAIDTNNDGTADFNACAIICEDTGAGVCTSPTCPATCPTPLQCTAELQGGTPPMTVAKACE